MSYKQGDLRATFREIAFSLRTSGGVPVTGATFATTDLQLRAPGASAYVNCNSTQQSAVVEIGGGDYVYTFTAAELATAGPGLSFKVGKTGAQSVTYGADIVAAAIGSVVSGSSAIGFLGTLTVATADHYKDAWVHMLTGACAGQVKRIGGMSTAGQITLAPTYLFSTNPGNGDIFEIINQ